MTRFKTFFIKLTNWEYWPFHVVYGPIYLYWFWLCLRARSFFFFNTANPNITNGGFLMESKKSIYDQLDPQYYPATILCTPNATPDRLAQQVQQLNQPWPLIAKPDIGMRGLKVQLLNSMEDLLQYASQAKVPFLLQQYINLPNEAGIFYYRIPGTNKGRISGVVAKEFLTVTGDGKSSIKALIEQNDRYLLQLPVLQKTYGKELQTVLPNGDQYTLVPYGNHCRGAKFLDFTNQVTPRMEEQIDRFCQHFPEFYFGRLDVRYNTWEELTEGKNFSVIEVNGAGSEPTHMYDPRHSIFFAWKEIIRHWNLLFKISMLNQQQKGIPFMSLSEGLQMFKDNQQQVALLST